MLNIFNGCKSLPSFTIPRKVTSIGEYAFGGCSALNSVTLPDGLTEIEYGVFADCKSLTTIDIPNSVTRIADYAFENCSALSTFTIPEGVTEIRFEAFAGCTALSSVNIPNSVTEIGRFAFENCKSLSTVVIPNSVTEIGFKAFYNVPHIEYYGIATGAPWGALSMNGNNFEIYTEYDDNTRTLTYYYDAMRESRTGTTELYDPVNNPGAARFAGYYNKIKKAVIDESMQYAPLTSMAEMFYGGINGKLQGLTALESIEGLENLYTNDVTDMSSMFFLCSSLPSLDLSGFNTSNVTTMNGMFMGCNALQTVDLSSFDISKLENTNMMFGSCAKLTTIYCNTDWSKSTTLTNSGYMFSGCNALVGGVGTMYDNSIDDKTYACPDFGPYSGQPGYFTSRDIDAIRALTTDATSTGDGCYYTLNGVKLSGKPTQKGIYILNGKKVVVK